MKNFLYGLLAMVMVVLPAVSLAGSGGIAGGDTARLRDRGRGPARSRAHRYPPGHPAAKGQVRVLARAGKARAASGSL